MSGLAAAFAVGLAPTLAIIANYLLSRRDSKRAGEKLDSIHVLVNNRMTEALERIAALEARYGLEAGQAIPPVKEST